MSLPPMFHSGDIIRMETSAGPLVARLVDPDDPNFVELKWDWPQPPSEDDDE